MTATSLEVITLCFPNPEWDSSTQFQRINSSISFTYITSFTLRTLSTTAAPSGSDATGLLYTPDLPPHDPCVAATAPYVPANATRQRNLPDTDYDLIALAPWVSPECTLKYLASARRDPVRGFLFFLPNNGTKQPPEEDARVWELPDSNWKKENKFPVYAIPGHSGELLMQASAEYSRNMTDVPHGHLLTETFDSRDYVRLYADIDTSSGKTLPSLWVFLLVVLGILLAIIGLTSGSMHYLQRRRRLRLRRRIASGEVDLEALGIKRLTVPQEILDKMPLYTYGSGVPIPPSATRDREAALDKDIEDSPPSSPLPRRPAPALRSTSYHPTPLSQPTCAICLDDFVPSTSASGATARSEGTIVRELPCHHIFHPECVDTFLRDSSSLCPMCKKSTLPKGYCPRVVTNAMVRRERMVRRIRPRATIDEETGGVSLGRAGSGLEGWRMRNRTTRGPGGSERAFSGYNPLGLSLSEMLGRRVASSPLPVVGRRSSQMTEMSSPAPALMRSSTGTFWTAAGTGTNTPPTGRTRSTSSGPTASALPAQPPRDVNRREWARQRALAMLGRQRALVVDADVEEERALQTTPRWRKTLRGMFPNR